MIRGDLVGPHSTTNAADVTDIKSNFTERAPWLVKASCVGQRVRRME
ncbi:hypothetical protein BQ8794_10452 [Mesorhizobium prunaredense]|uniref:Uncharacterized protein n=1 Tax=Mesorhizobium prunaredense TaxID=1631249 RepID=A0A1R3UZL6_9HYPH|nr:hypothetical protein BQ8794_10452 [Mesorhizobium prunaredense]